MLRKHGLLQRYGSYLKLPYTDHTRALAFHRFTAPIRSCFTLTHVLAFTLLQAQFYTLAAIFPDHKDIQISIHILRLAHMHFIILHPYTFDSRYAKLLDTVGVRSLIWGDPSDAEQCFRASLQ